MTSLTSDLQKKDVLLDEYNSLMRGGKIRPITMTPISSCSLRGRVCPDVRTHWLVLLHPFKPVGNFLPGPEQQLGKERAGVSICFSPIRMMLNPRLTTPPLSFRELICQTRSWMPRERYTFVEMGCLTDLSATLVCLCIGHGPFPSTSLGLCLGRDFGNANKQLGKGPLPSPSSHAGKMFPLVASGWACEWDAMEQGSPQLEIETILSLQISQLFKGGAGLTLFLSARSGQNQRKTLDPSISEVTPILPLAASLAMYLIFKFIKWLLPLFRMCSVQSHVKLCPLYLSCWAHRLTSGITCLWMHIQATRVPLANKVKSSLMSAGS